MLHQELLEVAVWAELEQERDLVVAELAGARAQEIHQVGMHVEVGHDLHLRDDGVHLTVIRPEDVLDLLDGHLGVLRPVDVAGRAQEHRPEHPLPEDVSHTEAVQCPLVPENIIIIIIIIFIILIIIIVPPVVVEGAQLLHLGQTRVSLGAVTRDQRVLDHLHLRLLGDILLKCLLVGVILN